MKLFTTIVKNMKLLFRSKGTSMMVLLGPLLVILLVGLAFNNTSSYDIAIGTYSSDYNELTTKYVHTLENGNYRVARFDSLAECINKIKEGTIHTCIAFPDDFKISNERQSEIVFYVDYSRVNIVDLVIGSLSSGVSAGSAEVTEQYATILVDKISATKSSLDSLISDVILLKNYNKEVIELADDASKNLASMSLESQSLDLSPIETEVQMLYDIAVETQDEGMDTVERGYKLIRDLQGKTVNATSIITTFKNDLDDINESLDDLLNLTANQLKDTTASIDSASAALSEINKKLGDADSKKTEVITQISSLKADLESLGNDIEGLKVSIESIIDDLNSIEVTNAERIAKPVNSRIEPVIAENTRLTYMFPLFLVLVIMFIGILLSSTLVITEKNSRAYFRINTTPSSDVMFIFATYLTTILLIVIQTVVILACAFYFLKAPMFDNFPITLLVIALTASLFSLLGMLIGYVFSTQEATAMVSISLSCVMFFLSNLVLPLESMALYIQKIAQYNPYVILSELARKSLLFQESIAKLYTPLLIIFGVCLLLFFMVFWALKFSKMRYLNRVPHIRKKTEFSKPETPKITLDDKVIGSAADILNLLKPMDDSQYYTFMGKYKAGLADWARNALKDKKLAAMLGKPKAVLINYLEKNVKESAKK